MVVVLKHLGSTFDWGLGHICRVIMYTFTKAKFIHIFAMAVNSTCAFLLHAKMSGKPSPLAKSMHLPYFQCYV